MSESEQNNYRYNSAEFMDLVLSLSDENLSVVIDPMFPGNDDFKMVTLSFGDEDHCHPTGKTKYELVAAMVEDLKKLIAKQKLP